MNKANENKLAISVEESKWNTFLNSNTKAGTSIRYKWTVPNREEEEHKYELLHD